MQPGKKSIPGFIDVHTHGAVGVDVNAATAEDYEKICRFAAGNGNHLLAVLCAYGYKGTDLPLYCDFKKHQQMEQKGANLLGIHLRGLSYPVNIRGLCRSIFCRRRIFLF